MQFNMDILRRRGVHVSHEQDIASIHNFLVTNI